MTSILLDQPILLNSTFYVANKALLFPELRRNEFLCLRLKTSLSNPPHASISLLLIPQRECNQVHKALSLAGTGIIAIIQFTFLCPYAFRSGSKISGPNAESLLQSCKQNARFRRLPYLMSLSIFHDLFSGVEFSRTSS